MNHNPQLTAHLKQLKLSGILETLDMRLSQAITEQMSCADFLQRPIEDEVERRHRRQFDVRVRRAAFQPDKTLERFDFSFNPQLNRQLIMELDTCQFVARRQLLLIVGPSGVGKSHLAQALGWKACKRGYEVLHTNCAKVLASLAAAHADGSYDRRIKALARPGLLILDDFGLKTLRGSAPEDVYDLINERYERGSTILTSNRALHEFPQRFGNPLLASAGLDRLFDNVRVVTITGNSFRARNHHKAVSMAAASPSTSDSPASPRPAEASSDE